MKPEPRRRTLRALGTLPLWLAADCALAQGTARSGAPMALGYLPWWMAPGWETLARQQLDRLVLFDAQVERDGSLLEREWRQRTAPLRQGSSLAMDLALTLLNEAEFDQVFADAQARERLLAAATRWCETPAIAGLHLDFEGFNPAHPDAVAGFRAWLGALDEIRRRLGKGLSAFFPASDRFAPYDAAGAGRIDWWVAQLYDAHWSESKVTGPLVTRAEENPVAVPRALGRLAALGIEPGKVLLSVPLYGWEWPSESEHPGAAARGAANMLTFAETPQWLMPNDRRVATDLASRHGLRRDREHTPYYAYRVGSHWVQGWYEDLASLTRKLAPERGQGYAGLAFFAVGYDQGRVIEAMLRWWSSPLR